MEQLGRKNRIKRVQRWKPTLRQIAILKAAEAYRSGNLQFCLTLYNKTEYPHWSLYNSL